MIAGPYSVMRVTPHEDDDGVTLDTVLWGYTSPEEAWADVPKLAKEHGIEAHDLAVVMYIDKP